MENRLSDFNYFWLLRSSPLGNFFEMMTKWCLVSNSPPSLSGICMTFFIQWRGIPHLWWYISDLLLHLWPCLSRIHGFSDLLLLLWPCDSHVRRFFLRMYSCFHGCFAFFSRTYSRFLYVFAVFLHTFTVFHEIFDLPLWITNHQEPIPLFPSETMSRH